LFFIHALLLLLLLFSTGTCCCKLPQSVSSRVYYRHSPGQETEVLLRNFANFEHYTPPVISTAGNLVHAFVVEFRKLVET
jgi:hypothetical protein